MKSTELTNLTKAVELLNVTSHSTETTELYEQAKLLTCIAAIGYIESLKIAAEYPAQFKSLAPRCESCGRDLES